MVAGLLEQREAQPCSVTPTALDHTRTTLPLRCPRPVLRARASKTNSGVPDGLGGARMVSSADPVWAADPRAVGVDDHLVIRDLEAML
jgi:hypothetical protein